MRYLLSLELREWDKEKLQPKEIVTLAQAICGDAEGVLVELGFRGDLEKECNHEPFSSRVCEKGTFACGVQHMKIGIQRFFDNVMLADQGIVSEKEIEADPRRKRWWRIR